MSWNSALLNQIFIHQEIKEIRYIITILKEVLQISMREISNGWIRKKQKCGQNAKKRRKKKFKNVPLDLTSSRVTLAINK